MSESYSAAEILAFSDMSWWEHAAREGLPTSLSRRAGRRIERGPYAVKQKLVRDYLSEPFDDPVDYLLDDWRL